jgi:putative two-component system response regulator
MSAYSRTIAEALSKGQYSNQVTRAFIDQLHKSSPLHDIGKVGIPDTILLKPGPLTPGEFAVMKTHSEIGGKTLRAGLDSSDAHGFLRMGMEIAYSHHERWDGQGYPDELAGTAIPLSARIVALADSYDALTSDRPYKQALPHSDAVRKLAADRGAHFDPAVVDAFLEIEGELRNIRRRVNSAVDQERDQASQGGIQ